MLKATAIFVVASLAAAQTFEVASVKPSPPVGSKDRFNGIARRGGPGSDDPGRVRLINFSLEALVSEAYAVSFFQVSGPDRNDQYIVEATLPVNTSKEQYRAMLQNLLAERFKLAVRREKKDLQGYSLVVAKNGPKFSKSKPVDAAADTDNNAPMGRPKFDKDGFPELPQGKTMMTATSINGKPRARLQGYNEGIAWLVGQLGGQLRAIVEDDTALTDKYDYTLAWVPQRPGAVPSETDDSGPSLFAALQEQLGLKLVSKKIPTDIIIIDHAEKTPTEN